MRKKQRRLLAIILSFVLCFTGINLCSLSVEAHGTEDEQVIVQEENLDKETLDEETIDEETIDGETIDEETSEAQSEEETEDVIDEEIEDIVDEAVTPETVDDPQDGVAINATNFPDDLFREYVSDTFDSNEDGILSSGEIESATVIDFDAGWRFDGGIHSLTGLEYFTDLKVLNIPANSVKSLDLSNQKSLEVLNCDGNQLLSLDLSHNTELVELHCAGQMNQDDYSYDRIMSEIDLSHNGNLEILDCSDNILEILDLDCNPQLKVLNCGSNNLTALNLRNNTELTDIDCSRNKLMNLSFVYNQSLKNLNCNSNVLTYLNLRTNEELESLDCSSNKNLGDLYVNYNTNLKYLNCYVIGATSLNLSENRELLSLYCGGDPIEELNLDNNRKLQELKIYGTDIDTLDLSNNTALTKVSCTMGSLTGINTSNCVALEELTCWDNSITSLDLSGNPNLKTLACRSNQLTKLDLSDCKLLNWVQCYDNNIAELDISCNPELINIYQNGKKVVQNNYIAYENDNVSIALIVPTNTSITIADPGVIDGKVKINGVNFPDPVFRSLVSRDFDTDNDGYLSETEINNATRMVIYPETQARVSNVKGIEFFTALTTLYLNSEPVSELDLSNNTALQDLQIVSTNLKSIDLSHNTALTKVMVAFHDNGLDSLDFSNNTNLTEIDCKDNSLTSLVLGNNSNLKTLNCKLNSLSSLDLSGCPGLTHLECDRNNLTALNVSVCPSLGYLDCHSNQIQTLDVSDNPNLGSFSCYSNQLTSLDVRNNTHLVMFSCADNQLTEMDISMCPNIQIFNCAGNSIESINISNQPKLIYCITDGVEFEESTSFDIFGDVDVETMNAWDNGNYSQYYLFVVDKTTEVNYEEDDGVAIDATNFPDEHFRTYVSDNFDTDKNGCLSINEIKNANTVELYQESQVENLKGIEFLTSLTSLRVINTAVSKVDLSKNTELYEVSLVHNQLSSLDFRANTKLQELYCSGNQLTSLDISNCSKLRILNCRGNLLTGINVSNCPSLVQLDCSKNNIDVLNVNNNTSLQLLYCFTNQLSTLDVSNNEDLVTIFCYDNDLTGINLGNKPELQILTIEGNQISEIDLSNCPVLQIFNAGNNQLENLDISKCPQLIKVYKNGTPRTGAGDTGEWGKYDSETMYIWDMSDSVSYYMFIYDKATKLSGVDPVSPMPTLAQTTKGVKVTWKADPVAEGYCIFRREEGGSWSVLAKRSSLVVSFEDTTGTVGKTYYYAVRCTNADGSKYTSPFDSKKVASIVYPTVSLISPKPALTAANDGVNISWTAVRGSSKYRIFKRTGTAGWTVLTDVSATSYKDSNVVNGTKYTYAIRCLSADGTLISKFDSAKTTEIVYQTGELVSPMPTLTAVSDGIKVSWTAVTGSTKYRVFRKIAGGSWTVLSDVSATSCTDTTGIVGKKYTYAVRCLANDGTLISKFDSKKTAEMVFPNKELVSPKPILVGGNDGINISWTVVEGSPKYRIFKRTGTAGWTVLKDISGTAYTDTNCVAGTKYTYAVRCLSADGTTLLSKFDSTKTAEMICPDKAIVSPKPTLASVSNGIKISWTTVEGAAKYRIFKRTGTAGWTVLTDVNGTSYIDTVCTAGTQYTYAVRCLDASGNLISKFDSKATSSIVK